MKIRGNQKKWNKKEIKELSLQEVLLKEEKEKVAGNTDV